MIGFVHEVFIREDLYRGDGHGGIEGTMPEVGIDILVHPPSGREWRHCGPLHLSELCVPGPVNDIHDKQNRTATERF